MTTFIILIYNFRLKCSFVSLDVAQTKQTINTVGI